MFIDVRYFSNVCLCRWNRKRRCAGRSKDTCINGECLSVQNTDINCAYIPDACSTVIASLCCSCRNECKASCWQLIGNLNIVCNIRTIVRDINRECNDVTDIRRCIIHRLVYQEISFTGHNRGRPFVICQVWIKLIRRIACADFSLIGETS